MVFEAFLDPVYFISPPDPALYFFNFDPVKFTKIRNKSSIIIVLILFLAIK